MPNQNTQATAVDKLAIVKQELPTLTAILALNNKPGTDVATIALQELQYLEQRALAKPDLLQCQPLSILLAVKSVMRKNLTLDPNAGLVYIKTRNVKVNERDWVTVLEITETCNGLISLNRQLGRILDFTNPQVQKNQDGKVVGVSMEILKPSFNQPRWEKFEYDESDFFRWRKASHKENSKSYKENSGKTPPNNDLLNYANALYTNWKNGIDPEFARAKCIKHSLKKLGTNINENTVVKVFDLPIPNVVDVNIDYAATEDGDFTQHEEVYTATTTEAAPAGSEPELPNANDL